MGSRTRLAAALGTAAATVALAATLSAPRDTTFESPLPPPTIPTFCTLEITRRLVCSGTPGQVLTLTVGTQTLTRTIQIVTNVAEWASPPITPPVAITITYATGAITATIPAYDSRRADCCTHQIIHAVIPPPSARMIHYHHPPAPLIPVAYSYPVTATTYLITPITPRDQLIIEHALTPSLLLRAPVRAHILFLPVIQQN